MTAMWVRRVWGLTIAVMVGGGVVGGGLDPSCQAQESLGDGRALDNNLQVGSGGVNQPQASPALGGRNDVVTGNVAGLGRFRDDVGYRAPGEFADGLGEDDLFRFRAQGLPSAMPLLTGGRDTGTGGANRAPVSVYRTKSGVGFGGGQVGGVRTGPGSLMGTNLGGVVIRDWRPMVGVSPLGLSPGVAERGRLGVAVQPDGRLLELNATPLMGVRLREINGSWRGVMPAHVGEGDRSGWFGTQMLTRPGGGNRPMGVGDRGADGGGDEGLTDTGRGGSSSVLGGRIKTKLEPSRIDTSERGREAEVHQIEADLFSPLDEMEDPSHTDADPYLNLLERVREDHSSGGAELGPMAPGPGDQTDPSSDPPSEREGAGSRGSPGVEGSGGKGLWGGAASSVHTPGLEYDAVGQRSHVPAPYGRGDRAHQVTDRTRAVGGVPVDRHVEGAGEPRLKAVSPAGRVATGDSSPTLDALIDKLDYDFGPMSSLAGRREDLLGGLMRQAEADLVAGRYMDAEERFGHILNLGPGYPLARVGLIHAQLGAGMLQSAAVNLRRHLEHHPELIAARYGRGLLPPAERLVWVRDQLAPFLEVSPHQASSQQIGPAVLLAYLAYQTGSRDGVERGLRLAGAAVPDDNLVVLLRRIWLDPVAPTDKP